MLAKSKPEVFRLKVMAPRLCSCTAARGKLGRDRVFCVLASVDEDLVVCPTHRILTLGGEASSSAGDSSLAGPRPELTATHAQFTFQQHLVPFRVCVWAKCPWNA